MNGSASVSGTGLQLTNGGSSEAGSAFYTTPVNIQAFTTNFSFKLTDPVADGFTFTIQNAGLTALGGIGGSLGYAGIGESVAIKFDLFQNAGDPSNNSTGIFVDGGLPIGPTSIDLTGTGINLHSGDKMDANLTYVGTTLTLTITDLVTLATWSHPFVIDIPATVGGNAAYVGFTGATGGESATHKFSVGPLSEQETIARCGAIPHSALHRATGLAARRLTATQALRASRRKDCSSSAGGHDCWWRSQRHVAIRAISTIEPDPAVVMAGSLWRSRIFLSRRNRGYGA